MPKGNVIDVFKIVILEAEDLGIPLLGLKVKYGFLLNVTNDSLIITKKGNKVVIPFKNILTYTIEKIPLSIKNLQGFDKCIKVIYSNKKGVQRFIKFYSTTFLSWGNDDKTISLYNTIHNIMARFGIVIGTEEEKGYFCHNCGAELKNKKAKYCSECGAKQ